jgi:catechol 2,3-dioxygenase-like lactoylglutathione lyase family enzyme
MSTQQTQAELDLTALTAERERLRRTYLRQGADRAPTTARGVHHVAVLCANVERTVQFYQDVLEFPLTDMFENRDYRGSTHFFFDIGNGNGLAFFDFPGLDLGDYHEVFGGLHHLAISMASVQWERIKVKLDAAGIAYQQIKSSLYFRDPDGTRLELIREPLGEMYGTRVL